MTTARRPPPARDVHGIAQIGNARFIADDYTAPNSFPLVGFVTASGAVVKLLAARGCKRVAPLVLIGKAPATTPTATFTSAQLAKASSESSDCIAAIVFSADAVKLLEEAKGQGIHEKFAFGQSSLQRALVTQLGGAADAPARYHRIDAASICATMKTLGNVQLGVTA
ncbi:MAG TPA: hypothetical protein VG294_15515 [Solirubrobacteraceae bacterium]|jgi:ABC-type branched-subunit amino acid transport system substrate-binding protein|nr:hypothetical protein [Solirubrobacteraceae bacterium]